MDQSLHFVGISGSLRKGSFNTKLLQEAMRHLPEGVTMEIVSIVDIPVYNADNDIPAAPHRPQTVQAFRDKLAQADAIVFVSPEYNYSIPGGLKNAIDWASRGEDAPLKHKPVAIMGATTGLWGTVRMQLAFQNVFLFLDMKPVQKPEVLVANAAKKFDDDGRLTDDIAIELVRKKLEGLKDLALSLQVTSK